MTHQQVLEQIAGILTRQGHGFDTARDGMSYRIVMESSALFLHVLGADDEPIVRITAPLLQDLDLGGRRGELLRRLNEINCRDRFVKLYLQDDDVVVAHYAMRANDMHGVELMAAILIVGGISEELDDTLKFEFGGQRLVEAHGLGADEDVVEDKA